LLILATALLVIQSVPHVVGFGWDLELNRVITACNGGKVPLELSDFAAFVEVLEDQDEDHTDQGGSSNGQAHEVVLGGKLGLALDAGILNEEIIRLIVATLIEVAVEHVSDAEMNKLLFFAMSRLEHACDAASVWLANLVLCIVDASIGRAPGIDIVQTVLHDLANRAISAVERHFTKTKRSAIALNA